MSWLTDDPEVLGFVLDAVDTWDESDMDTTSSDELSDATRPPEHVAVSARRVGVKKKTRSRYNRREEIVALRAQAASLTESLESLQLQCQAKPPAENALAQWQHQARRELFARRQAEGRNAWLRATLTRHVKTSRRLMQLINEIKKIPTDAVTFEEDHTQSTSNARTLAVEIHDRSPTDAVVIEVTDAWRFNGHDAAAVEAALWTLFSADHMRRTQFAVDYEIISCDDSSVQSSFTIYSCDGVQFQGVLSAYSQRDDLSRDLIVSTTSETSPVGVNSNDAFADATLLEEESQYRLRGAASSSSSRVSTTTAVAVERRFRLHAADASGPRRLEIARAVASHLQEEMQWMQQEVERRTLLHWEDHTENELHSPKPETLTPESPTTPEETPSFAV